MRTGRCGQNYIHPHSHPPTLPYPHTPFDWVVGNPPFGTLSLRSSPDFEQLARAIRENFTIWRDGQHAADLAKYRIEVLFLERFWQLARPGGYVAMVVPDGILANARLSYVREWLSSRAAIRAIVSLPRHTFYRTGAASKASVLVFQRNPALPGRVFSAALESRASWQAGIERLAEQFADFAQWSAADEPNLTPGPSPMRRGEKVLLPPLRGEAGRGVGQSATRNPKSSYAKAPADKSEIECLPWVVFPAEILSPGDRLDPAYYHRKYTENLRLLRGLPNAVTLGELIEYTTYGQVGKRELAESGVRLLTPANLVTTGEGFVIGVDIRSPERFVPPGSRNDPARSRLQKGDLLLANSGVGCIGRAAVFYSDEPCNISQHINLVRVRDVEPEYLAVYLQTRFARLQIHREKCGVGPCGINFDRIKSILVPILPQEVRREIVERYRQLSSRPDTAGRPIRSLVERLEQLILLGQNADDSGL
ncbi:MAG TPA: N-6 DNA methylase [Armatimonadota bacterium]|nr:N-6 DNA methylase [Armatimonadota bacterium]